MADPTLTLWHHFASSKSLSPIAGLGPTLSCVRALATASRYNSLGILETNLGANTARFDHNPVTGASLGLLVEEARTNICLQSEDFGTTWTPNGSAALNTNQAVAPDGTTTADQLIDDGLTGESTVNVFQSLTIAIDTVFTVSIYCKVDQLDWVYLEVGSLGSLVINSYFDLTNGVVGSTPGAGNTSEFIQDVGNGWFRCGIVFTSDAADSAGAILIGLSDGDNDKTVTRDGTSSIFVWGADLEAGAFPTSYIPTLASSVLRNADVVSTTDVSWLNESAGTMYSVGSHPNETAGAKVILEISDNSSSDRMLQATTTSNDVNYIQVAASSTVVNLISAANEYAGSAVGKVATAYALNDVETYANGSRIGTGDQSAALPVGLSDLNAGSTGTEAGANFWNGHIKELRYYNARKNNQFLEDLSNGLISEANVPVYPIGLQSDLMFRP